MNSSFRFRGVCGALLALSPLGAAPATHAQQALVPLTYRHSFVRPHPWFGTRTAISQRPRLRTWIASGPLVPRVQAERAAAQARLGVGALAAAPAPTAPDWTAIGPAPTNISGTGYGGYIGNSSGRVSAIAADPTNANTYYVGAAGGGVWKTTNGGNSYTPLTDGQVNMATGAVALSPNDHNRLYVGTGEANFSGDSRYGGGILISANGGATFTRVVGPGNAFDGNTISRIVVVPSAGPAGSETVYAATAGGPNGVYMSTDGGTTWTQSFAAPTSVTDLVIDPTNPLVLYAAVGNPGGSAGNGVYKTVTGGVGGSATWINQAGFRAAAADPVGRISLAIGQPTPGLTPAATQGTVYASISNSSTAGLLYVRKTTDGGTTWTSTTAPPNYLGGQGWYDNTIAVSPTDPNVVVAAGVISYQFGSEHGVIGSIDGGTTWNDYTVASGPDANGNIVTPHTDHHALAFTANGRLLDGNDGGVWRLETPTEPNNLRWTDRNTNLGTIQFTGIALHPTDPAIAYGGAQDNGTSKFMGSQPWNEIVGGDGGYVRVDQDTPQTVYQEFYDLSLNRSDDGGQTFNSTVNGINPADPTHNDDPPDAGTEPTNFYVPYILDATNQRRVLLGTNHVYESLNRGGSFTPIGSPTPGGFNPNGNVIDAVGAVGPNVYAAAAGQFFATVNDGASWNQRDLPGSPGTISDIYVSPQFPTTVYVTVAAFTGSTQRHVFRTLNAGVSWTDVSGNAPATSLPDQPYNTVEVDPADGTIYVGGDDGVYASNDSGATWARLGMALPNVQVVDLTISQGTRTLGAGTHGRGMWIYPLAGNTSMPNLVVQTALTRDANTGVLSATLTFRNIGFGRATNVTIRAVTADGAPATPATTTVGNIPGFGASAPITVQIPDAPVNSYVSIEATGAFTEGGYNSRNSVIVPLAGLALDRH